MHPNMLLLQRALFKMWHIKDNDLDAGVDLDAHPFAYIDRIRLRQPGDENMAYVREHMDSSPFGMLREHIMRSRDTYFIHSYFLIG